MPRIHYPKGIGTSRLRGRSGRAVAASRGWKSILYEGSWDVDETSGRIMFSVSRVRCRPGRHSPNRPRRGGSHRTGDFPGRVPPPGSPVAVAISKGSVGEDLPEEAFQRGAPCRAASPHVPGPIDCATDRASGCPPVPVPLHRPVRASRRTSGPSTRGPTPSPTPETRLAALPLTTSRGLRGTHKAFPGADGDDWRYPVVQAVRAS